MFFKPRLNMNIETKHYKRLICLGLFVINLSSCDKKHHHTPADKKYTFSLHLQAGQKFYIRCKNQTQLEITSGDKNVKEDNSVFTGLRYDVVKDSGAFFIIKVTYDSIHTVLNKNGTETEIDAANGLNSLNPVERMLALIKQKPIFIYINPRGVVTKIAGLNEMLDAVVSASGMTDKNAVQQLQAQLRGMLDENFLRKNIATGANLAPDSAIYAGDSWTGAASQANALGLKLVSTYTLSDINGQTAGINAESSFKTGDTTLTILGNPLPVNLEATGKSAFKIDLATGMLREAKESTTVKGMITVGGKELPLKSNTQKEITVRKL